MDVAAGCVGGEDEGSTGKADGQIDGHVGAEDMAGDIPGADPDMGDQFGMAHVTPVWACQGGDEGCGPDTDG